MVSRFESRKTLILDQLDLPDSVYQDLSPKGSVDEPIRNLIREINALDGLVTTSSCSGRISVFLEGRKTMDNDVDTAQPEQSLAGPGGKGGGGAWLFISHSPVDVSSMTSAPSYMSMLGLESAVTEKEDAPGIESRYIHLKFEPMILHILTASMNHAQRVLTAGLGAGFRESGAVSLGSAKTAVATPMVAVRSTGYSFDCIVGYQDSNSRNVSLVDEQYLQSMVAIANDRFRINSERIARFHKALIDTHHSVKPNNPAWEDADARKLSKREAGLARQQAMKAQETRQSSWDMSPSEGISNNDLVLG